MAARGCSRSAREMVTRWTMTRSAMSRPCLQDLHPSPAVTRTFASSSWLDSRHVPKPTKGQPSAGATQPVVKDTQYTFGRRLKFLQVHHRPPRIAVIKKRYRPGFQPGDFMCPQCGSHNHRPPEYDQSFNSQSSLLTSNFGSDQGHGASSRQLVTRNYPAGAHPACFECGYETRIPGPSSVDAASPHPRSSSTLGVLTSSTDSLQETKLFETENTATQEEDDLRRPKPRDYVCPNCRTLNFSGRLYCMGCGILNTRAKSRIFKRDSTTKGQ